MLDRLQPEHRDFLVRASVLTRLSGPLCDTVLQRAGSAEVLHHLEARNLFVGALDRHQQWYRCHGLLRDVLRRDLDPMAVPGLLGRAADWYAAEGRLDEAVRLRIEARDGSGATALLRTHDEWFLDRGAAATFLDLGERLAGWSPPDPQVSLMLIYAAVLSGRFDRVATWSDVTEALLTGGCSVRMDGWHSARAALLAMRAAYGHDEDADPGAILAEALQAAELEHDPSTLGFVVARVVLGSTLARAGRFENARPAFEVAWSRPSRRRLPTSIALQSAGLYGLTLVQLGLQEQAKQIFAEAAPSADRIEQDWGDAAAASVTWLRLAEGRLLLSAGDSSAARPVLRGSPARGADRP